MGGCATKNEEPEEAHALGRSFGPMFNLHNGVCKIEVNQAAGTAFLCYFTVGEFNKKIHGIVTNNYILPEEDLVNDFTLKFDAYLGGKTVNMEETIHPQNRFRFTCPVLDATFVHLTDEEVQSLCSRGRKFLELLTKWDGMKGDEILIIQQQAGFKTQFAQGTYHRRHGFNFLHTAAMEIGSWGSPIAIPNGRIVGLHKRNTVPHGSQYNVGLSISALIGGMYVYCKNGDPPKRLVTNRLKLDSAFEEQIEKAGLRKCASRNNRIALYVAEQNQPSPDQENPHAPLIWFTLTGHGWYWTPTDPFDRAQETNWMSLMQGWVVGGKMNGWKLSEKDVKIVNWLKTTKVMVTSYD